MKPLVSICSITYNHEKYISDAIESFLMQKTSFPFEIIIHDDASTDNTAKIIKQYEEKYPDIIKPIYQKENQWSKGIISPDLVYIIPRIQGKYMATCEGDDYWTDPYKLQKQFECLESNPEYTACFHAVKCVDTNKKPLGSYIGPYGEGSKVITADTATWFKAPHLNSIFNRAGLLKGDLPPWYTRMHGVRVPGDRKTYIYSLMMGKLYYMDEVMSAYRVGVEGSQMTTLRNSHTSQDMIQIYQSRILVYNEVDDYYSKKYHSLFANLIEDTEIGILMLKNDLPEIKSRSAYKKFNLKTKISLHLKYYLPGVVFSIIVYAYHKAGIPVRNLYVKLHKYLRLR